MWYRRPRGLAVVVAALMTVAVLAPPLAARPRSPARPAASPAPRLLRTLPATRALPVVAADDTHLYWATAAGIERAPRDGGAPAVVVPVAGELVWLAVVGERLYFRTQADRLDDTLLWSAPRAGGEPVVVASLPRTELVAADARCVVWTDRDGLSRWCNDQAAAELLVSSHDLPRGGLGLGSPLAVLDGDVVGATWVGVDGWQIRQLAGSGSAPWWRDRADARDVALSATHVCWLELGRGLVCGARRGPKPRGKPRVVVATGDGGGLAGGATAIAFASVREHALVVIGAAGVRTIVAADGRRWTSARPVVVAGGVVAVDRAADDTFGLWLVPLP